MLTRGFIVQLIIALVLFMNMNYKESLHKSLFTVLGLLLCLMGDNRFRMKDPGLVQR